jgi:hypothetical protein
MPSLARSCRLWFGRAAILRIPFRGTKHPVSALAFWKWLPLSNIANDDARAEKSSRAVVAKERLRHMFPAGYYRAKAADPHSPAQAIELRNLEQTYRTLADNEEWLARNADKVVQTKDDAPASWTSSKGIFAEAPTGKKDD